MHPTDYLVHFSNVLMLVAYSVTDILWLRWFAVAAALTNIPYFLGAEKRGPGTSRLPRASSAGRGRLTRPGSPPRRAHRRSATASAHA